MIEGFDDISYGGMLVGRIILVSGIFGIGKILFVI